MIRPASQEGSGATSGVSASPKSDIPNEQLVDAGILRHGDRRVTAKIRSPQNRRYAGHAASFAAAGSESCAAIHFSTTGAIRLRHLLPLKMP